MSRHTHIDMLPPPGQPSGWCLRFHLQTVLASQCIGYHCLQEDRTSRLSLLRGSAACWQTTHQNMRKHFCFSYFPVVNGWLQPRVRRGEERKHNLIAHSGNQAARQSFKVLSMGAFANLHFLTIFYISRRQTLDLLHLYTWSTTWHREAALMMRVSFPLSAEFLAHGQCVRDTCGLTDASYAHIGIGDFSVNFYKLPAQKSRCQTRSL